MSATVWCPVCGNAEEVPVPEWAEDEHETEEVCPPCAVELYGDDESKAP